MADPRQEEKRARKSAARAARLNRIVYEAELRRLQVELALMLEWVRDTGARIAVVFEGRDASGKGSTLKRILEPLNPRYARLVALPVPTSREKSQWYFQRYVGHLPAAGEIVLFDRSWYNRAGVEKVMGYCTPQEHQRFLRQCPVFEQMLVEDGILLRKYWFSVSDEEQERRFRARLDDPTKRWKLSDTDLESRRHFIDYSRAKDEMFVHTDTEHAPWWVVEADSKRNARLNCIAHLLSTIPYEVREIGRLELPPRQPEDGYIRPDPSLMRHVPDHARSVVDAAAS
ncbi:MAG: polyphosphate kinase 2 [Gaiella sp.]